MGLKNKTKVNIHFENRIDKNRLKRRVREHNLYDFWTKIVGSHFFKNGDITVCLLTAGLQRRCAHYREYFLG